VFKAGSGNKICKENGFEAFSTEIPQRRTENMKKSKIIGTGE
jgi:hypothetical protein